MSHEPRQYLQLPSVLKLAMHVSEVLLVVAAFYVFFKNTLSPGSHSFHDTSSLFNWLAMTLVLCYVAAVWLRPISFFYRGSRYEGVLSNVLLTVLYIGVFFGGFVVVVGRTRVVAAWRLLEMFAVIYVAMCAWRYAVRSLIRYLRSRGRNQHRVVFVGAGDNILELWEEMRNPFYGYHVLGYFNASPVASYPDGLTYLGPVGDAVPYMEQHSVQQLYCCLPSAMAAEIRPLITWCEGHFVRFFSVPNVRNYLKRQMQLEMLGEVPVLYIHDDPLMRLSNRIIKRTFDIVVAGIVMIPFWLIVYPVVAVITKLTSPGPVFFKQKRNGLNGRVFDCYKFRSMRVNADADRLQATADDPRKTRFGNFLRRSSIDELPQFINVLMGDMSVVGPRPHMLRHTEEYAALIDKYMVRHWVRPGITGWAQVNGARGETRELWQMEDRIRKDIWYIENWSLWLDVRIIWLTVWRGIAGDKQAY